MSIYTIWVDICERISGNRESASDRRGRRQAKAIYEAFRKYGMFDQPNTKVFIASNNEVDIARNNETVGAPVFDPTIASALVRTVGVYQRHPSYDALRFVADGLSSELGGTRLDDNKYIDVRKVCGHLMRSMLPGSDLAYTMLTQIDLKRALEDTQK